MTLHTHLKAHHTVKMIDGVEVIKLPNWMELVLKHDFEYSDDSSLGFIIYEYTEFMQKPPTLSQFVPVGKNGEVLEEPIEIHPSHHEEYELYLSELQQYETAQSNVIYEGWEVITNGKNLKSVAGTFNGKRFRLDFVNGICKAAFASIVFKTTDDLNREVQLYLKIK